MCEERKPTVDDMVAAKKEWQEENPNGNWDTLRTQTKNRLAKEQMFHREYYALCNAIIGPRK